MTVFVYEYKSFGGSIPDNDTDNTPQLTAELVRVSELDTATEKLVVFHADTSIVRVEAYDTDAHFIIASADPGAGTLASTGTRQRIAAGGIPKDTVIRTKTGSQRYTILRTLNV